MKWSQEDWSRLGLRIREAREGQGLSRRQLSEMTGVSEKSIQLTEEGRVPTRWPKTLYSIEDGLGWGTGSTAAILDGGKPLPRPTEHIAVPADLDVVGAEERAEIDTYQSEMHEVEVSMLWAMEQEGVQLSDLPLVLQRGLPATAAFLTHCAVQGASTELAIQARAVIAAMLKQAADEYRQESARRKTRTTEQLYRESREQLRMLRAEREAMLGRLLVALELMEKAPDDLPHRDFNIKALRQQIDELTADIRASKKMAPLSEG